VYRKSCLIFPPPLHIIKKGIGQRKEGFCHATFNFEGELTEGDMPLRQRKFIAARAELHKDELIANWELAMAEQPLYKIEPLR